ncbi:hypothetical protein [Acaryochloris sp. IP29b_bin.148]|uniref:hypothetical protein n=1 Tax=Acaryochloris sp. IP29b_bin.148 TaxID=2969218 RepID=UPI0026116AB9|nr:hypothetical protein [Acaryochloris sp. IP29b_bin.148]
MKSICPTCQSTLYIPNDKQYLRKCSVLCSNCHSIYFASTGTVVGAWLGYSYHRRAVYQARIQLDTGATKTVALNKLIKIDEPIVLLTPLKGLGKLKPILLIEKKTANPVILVHPRQNIRKFQLQGAIGAAILIFGLGLALQGAIAAIIVAAIASSFAVAIAIARVHRGGEENPQIRSRLLLEQRLLRQSADWGQRVQQLQKEFSHLYHTIQRLRPYDEDQLFQIDSLSKKPKERRYFENRYHILSELIEYYLLAKSLIDTSVPIIQLTAEIPLDLKAQLSNFDQRIKHLEHEYQVDL